VLHSSAGKHDPPNSSTLLGGSNTALESCMEPVCIWNKTRLFRLPGGSPRQGKQALLSQASLSLLWMEVSQRQLKALEKPSTPSAS